MELFKLRMGAALEAQTVNAYLDNLKVDYDTVKTRLVADDPNSELANEVRRITATKL